MASKISLNNPRSHSRARSLRAASLTEVLVTLGVSGLFIAVLASFISFHGRGAASMLNYIDLNQTSQRALNQMIGDIRRMYAVTNASASAISLIDQNGGLTTYTYDKRARTLTRTAKGRSNVLLKTCNSMTFTLDSADVTKGTFDCVAATSAADCKAVTITFTCSRTVQGGNTDDLQPHVTRVVLRN
jgi:hypothetical protein